VDIASGAQWTPLHLQGSESSMFTRFSHPQLYPLLLIKDERMYRRQQPGHSLYSHNINLLSLAYDILLGATQGRLRQVLQNRHIDTL